MKIIIKSLDNIREAAREFVHNMGKAMCLRSMARWVRGRRLLLRRCVKSWA